MTEARQCEYLFRLVEDEQRLVYVSSAADGGHETFRLFLGIPPHLPPVLITYLTRDHDGGTTVVETGLGGLVVPGRPRDEPPAWFVEDARDPELVHRTEVVPLDPGRYVITEAAPQVTIQSR